MADSLDEKLHDVFTLPAAIPVLNEYLTSIHLDDDNPGFLLSWNLDNLHAFVDAANAQHPKKAPPPVWLQMPPPHITVHSFTDDLVHQLHRFAGGSCGRLLLAPNSLSQIVGIARTLGNLESDEFMQEAARVASVNTLATTYYLTETNAQQAQPSNFPPTGHNGRPLLPLFI